jgi:hypothetical protein
VKVVKGYGGRFLEKGEDGMWHEMSAKAQRKKASQGAFGLSCLFSSLRCKRPLTSLLVNKQLYSIARREMGLSYSRASLCFSFSELWCSTFDMYASTMRTRPRRLSIDDE